MWLPSSIQRSARHLNCVLTAMFSIGYKRMSKLASFAMVGHQHFNLLELDYIRVRRWRLNRQDASNKFLTDTPRSTSMHPTRVVFKRKRSP